MHLHELRKHLSTKRFCNLLASVYYEIVQQLVEGAEFASSSNRWHFSLSIQSETESTEADELENEEFKETFREASHLLDMYQIE